MPVMARKPAKASLVFSRAKIGIRLARNTGEILCGFFFSFFQIRAEFSRFGQKGVAVDT